MLSFQAELLAQLADRLNRHARVLPWVCTAVGAVVGLGAGHFVATATMYFVPGSGPFFVTVLGAALALGSLTYFLARGMALAFQLLVQTALSQVKIVEQGRSPQR